MAEKLADELVDESDYAMDFWMASWSELKSVAVTVAWKALSTVFQLADGKVFEEVVWKDDWKDVGAVDGSARLLVAKKVAQRACEAAVSMVYQLAVSTAESMV